MFEEEYVLSKQDIANYLYDFYSMILIAVQKKNQTFWDAFCDYMGHTNRVMYIGNAYFFEMVNIFTFFLIKSINSILYDANFDDISCDDIKIDDSIFVNKKDAKLFNNPKHILRYIRNAINHNNGSHEIYCIKRINHKLFIEINLLDVRSNKEKKASINPKPFHVLIPFDKYFEIMSKALYSVSNKYIFIDITGDISNLKSNNCYTLLDKVSIKKCYPMKDRNINEDSLKYIYDNYPQRIFKLNKLQKLKIKEDLDAWEKLCAKGIAIIEYLVTSSFPLPEFRKSMMEVLLDFTVNYVGSPGSKTISSFGNDTKKMIQSFNQKASLVNKSLANFSNDASRLCAVYDWDLYTQMCCFIYCGYVFDTIVNDESIEIDGRKIPRNKFRNSIVHSRWCATKNGNFEFYDWLNNMEDEYNKNSPSFWNEYISWDGLKQAAYQYHQKICHDHTIDFPIMFNKSLVANYYNSISYTRNGLTWVLNTTSNYSNKKYLPWGIYCVNGDSLRFVTDDDEIALFLKEIHKLPNLSEKAKENLKRFIIKQNRATQDYINSIISKEELMSIHHENDHNLAFDDSKVLNKYL